jgi:hypothetical protein
MGSDKSTQDQGRRHDGGYRDKKDSQYFEECCHCVVHLYLPKHK